VGERAPSCEASVAERTQPVVAPRETVPEPALAVRLAPN
jgi:hypothetical protein